MKYFLYEMIGLTIGPIQLLYEKKHKFAFRVYNDLQDHLVLVHTRELYQQNIGNSGYYFRFDPGQVLSCTCWLMG